MNRKLTTLALGMAAVLAAVPALGQETKPVGLSVRLGVFLPSDSGTQSAVGKTWFGGGVEYKIQNLNFGTMNKGYTSALSISLDYYSKSSVSMMPITVNYVGSMNEFFYTAGAGIAMIRDGSTENRFCYVLGLGYNFTKGPQPIFLEARYLGVPSATGAQGFGIFVGTRF
jgi:hypothetical protein